MASASAAGFAKGFATGFVNERNRRLDETSKTDEITLRYQLENLSKEKADWQKKSEEEQKQLDAAKFVAKQVDNPAFAATALQAIKAGYDPQDVVQRYTNGEWEQTKPLSQTLEIPNSIDTKTPVTADTASTPVLPAGVKPTVNTVQTPEMNKKISGVQVADASTTADLKPEQAESLSRANAKIDAIDPALRTYKEKNKLPALESIYQSSDTAFKYKGPTKTINLGTYDEEMVKLKDLESRGDTVGLERQKMVVQTMQENMMHKADLEAKAQGKNLIPFIIVDKDGYQKSVVMVDMAQSKQGVYNDSTGNEIKLGPDERVIQTNEDDLKYTRQLEKDYQKPISDYNIQAQSIVKSIGTTRQIFELLDKPGNEKLNDPTTALLPMIDTAFASVENIKNMIKEQTGVIDLQKGKLNQLIQDGADTETFSQEYAVLRSQMINLEKSIPESSLSDPLKQRAMDKLRLENLKLMAAYDNALANGQTTGKMSNRDFQVQMKLSGGDTNNNQALKVALLDQTRQQRGKIILAQQNLTQEIRDRQTTLPEGYKLRIEPKRVFQMIQDPADLKFIQTADEQFKTASSYTVDQFNAATKKDQLVQPDADIPTITEDEYSKLPSGTIFYRADKPGQKFKKP